MGHCVNDGLLGERRGRRDTVCEAGAILQGELGWNCGEGEAEGVGLLSSWDEEPRKRGVRSDSLPCSLLDLLHNTVTGPEMGRLGVSMCHPQAFNLESRL